MLQEMNSILIVTDFLLSLTKCLMVQMLLLVIILFQFKIQMVNKAMKLLVEL